MYAKNFAGIFISQLITTDLVFGKKQNEEALLLGEKTTWKWHWALGFNAVFAIYALPLMFFSVETPRYLFLEQGKEDAARVGE